MTILSISGLIASGKDSVANYLITQHGFKRVSFANSLKDAVAAIFGWDRALLEGHTQESRVWREQVDSWWADRLGMPDLSPRWVLQYWGTDVCRNRFHTDIWVASVENLLRSTTDDVVITDCRFKNELNAIKKQNGITVRIHRGPPPSWYDDAIAYNKGPDGNVRWATGKASLDRFKVHASEYSSIGYKYDYNIDNNKTLNDLHLSIEDIIQNIRQV